MRFDREGDPEADGQAQTRGDAEANTEADAEAHADADTDADAQRRHAESHAEPDPTPNPADQVLPPNPVETPPPLAERSDQGLRITDVPPSQGLIDTIVGSIAGAFFGG